MRNVRIRDLFPRVPEIGVGADNAWNSGPKIAALACLLSGKRGFFITAWRICDPDEKGKVSLLMVHVDLRKLQVQLKLAVNGTEINFYGTVQIFIDTSTRTTDGVSRV